MSEVNYRELVEMTTFFERLANGARAVVVEMSPSVLDLSKEVIFGDTEHDVDLPVDEAIKNSVWDVMWKQPFHRPKIRYLYCEGSKPRLANEEGDVDLYVDPLDGSLNHQMARGDLGLPYTFVAYLMPVGATKIGDVIGCIVAELRVPQQWVAFRDQDGIVSQGGLGAKLQVDKTATTIDGQHIYGGEMYYPENRAILMKIYGDQKGWFRNPGSAAYEMASVATGQMAMFVCCKQKQHELPAAYLLVKGAGGVAVTLDGEDLGEQSFDFNSQTSTGLFATEALKDEVLRRIHS